LQRAPWRNKADGFVEKIHRSEGRALGLAGTLEIGMALDLDLFVERRPYAYHLTGEENFRLMRTSRAIRSAAEMIESAGCSGSLRVRRRKHAPIQITGTKAFLRDQDPLHEGEIRFEGGWKMADLVEELNRHVFFWPGTVEKPNGYGIRHFGLYSKSEKPVILRVPTASLLSCNPRLKPHFCRFNSGSPRCVGGKKSPRGPDTFLPADRFPGTSSDVAELTFRGAVQLPALTEYASTPYGPWTRFIETQR
jgi:hypothetical protein